MSKGAWRKLWNVRGLPKSNQNQFAKPTWFAKRRRYFRRLLREGEEIMANITRRNPLSELTTFQERLNQFFSPPFAPLWRLAGGTEPALTASSFVPAVDIYEDEHNIILTAETPGIEEKDLDISVENGVLTVSGERRMDNEEKQDNFHRIERSYGRFTRSFTLPPTVDENGVKADFNNGVLKITLAKREGAKPKQIKIESGKAPATKPGKAA
jgi:HSP20 family protein